MDLFVAYFTGNMGPRHAFTQEKEHVDVPSLHPLYQFPQSISQSMLNNYSNKLGWLYNSEFALAPVADWSWLNRVGMVAELESFWQKQYVGDGSSFQFQGGEIFSRFRSRFLGNRPWISLL